MSEIKPVSGIDDRVKLADAIPLSTPFTLNVFPTNSCNFRCNYCAQSLGSESLKAEYGLTPGTMSLELFKRVVEQSKGFPERFKLVSMMGHGEPLVNPYLPEMIHLAKQAGIAGRIDIITNASLLNKEKTLALIDAGLDVIRISIQGLSTKKYKMVSHVDFDFDELVSNIAFFYHNRKSCQVFIKIMDVALEDGEEEKFYKIFNNISDRMYVEKVKPVYDSVVYTQKNSEVNSDRYGNVHEKRYVCPQPFYMLSLWPSGDVASCDAIYKANILGNINDGNLVDMWKSEPLRNFRIMQLEKKRECHSACSRCCAPDDVAHPADILDPYTTKLLKNL